MIIINYAVGRRSFSQSRSTETTKLCCFPADDDQFSKLKAVLLTTGRGCRQDVPLVEPDPMRFDRNKLMFISIQILQVVMSRFHKH